jgi:hypothetical protein
VLCVGNDAVVAFPLEPHPDISTAVVAMAARAVLTLPACDRRDEMIISTSLQLRGLYCKRYPTSSPPGVIECVQPALVVGNPQSEAHRRAGAGHRA